MIGIPDGFKSVKKVYAIEYDNGEAWEDAYHDIDLIFDNRDEVVRYLIDRGLFGNTYDVRESTVWKAPKYVCSMGNIDCEGCPKCNGDDFCDEWDDRMDSEWDNSFYMIREYDVIAEDV